MFSLNFIWWNTSCIAIMQIVTSKSCYICGPLISLCCCVMCIMLNKCNKNVVNDIIFMNWAILNRPLYLFITLNIMTNGAFLKQTTAANLHISSCCHFNTEPVLSHKYHTRHLFLSAQMSELLTGLQID